MFWIQNALALNLFIFLFVMILALNFFFLFVMILALNSFYFLRDDFSLEILAKGQLPPPFLYGAREAKEREM